MSHTGPMITARGEHEAHPVPFYGNLALR